MAPQPAEQALALSPDHPDGLRTLILTQLRAERFDEASRNLERYTGVFPDSLDVYDLRATLHEARGEYEDARRAYAELMVRALSRPDGRVH
ncbi:hypothetical protein DF186_14250, partial [Enterococcus hirae]